MAAIESARAAAGDQIQAAVADVGDELDVWLMPTLQYTKSNEHAWSPGTLWYSAQTMMSMLMDLGRCLATTGAERNPGLPDLPTIAESGYPGRQAWADEYVRAVNSDADAVRAFGPRDGRTA